MAPENDPPRIPAGKLLVAAPARLDDACFSLPATRALAALDQVSSLHLLCPADQAPLWQTLPEIGILTHPPGAAPRAIAADIADSGLSFAAALAWQPGPAARALRLADVGERFAPADPPPAGFTAIPATRRPGPPAHRVREFLLPAETLGASPFDAAHFRTAELGVDAPRHSIALVPDSDFGRSHHWADDRWAEVGRELTDQCGLTPTVIGPGPAAESLAAALDGKGTLESPASLDERLHLLARHHHVIACDGSTPHLAAHVGATCVVLFGPNDPQRARPLGRRHHSLHRHVECAPCSLARCPLDHRCMVELSVERVLATLARCLTPDR